MCFLKGDKIEGKIEGRRRTIKKKERRSITGSFSLIPTQKTKEEEDREED